MAGKTIEKADIQNAIHALGLEGQCICLHTSMRSFGGPVQGGAEGLIAAFLEAGCTLMVPAFANSFMVYPPHGMRPARNAAGDYTGYETRQYAPAKIFTPQCNDLDLAEMGALPQALLQMPGRQRGNNPVHSMATIGPQATQLVGGQAPMDIWAPFRALCRLGGSVLLAGVGLDRATLIHHAEQAAGRAPFVRWALDGTGAPAPCQTGGCSLGFGAFAGCLAEIEATARVGGSLWRRYPAQQMTDRCVAALEADPAIAHCGDPGCLCCRDAMLGGPVWG